jgi:LacI family transcriptional regulator
VTARPVTLADVAREAGTSASTASRALSGRGYVAPDVRKRLVATADRLGYVPNLSARTLKQHTSRVVGVVVSDLGNPFYAALAAGIEQELREAGYQMLLLGDNSDVAQELTGVRTFLSMRAPGVIMTPASTSAIDLLVARGLPVVEVDRRLATSSCDAVVIDNERGARHAVEHLMAHGHTRIGMLMAKTTWTTDAGRLLGYRAAHVGAGLKLDRSLVVKIGTHAPDVKARVEALLDHAPTAIFAANNQLAEMAWQVLRDRKLSIPRDISLVAFDDVPWMSMVQPSITAVAQPTFEMGRRAALLLLRRLEDPSCGRTVEVLEPRLVMRGSAGARR